MEEIKDWLEAAIMRESTPSSLREGTLGDFLKSYGLSSSTYYYQIAKKENQEKILEICLNQAKKHAPDVLENLGQRAHKDNKAAELYIDYILKLASNLDIKSDGKPLPIMSLLNVPTNTSDNQDNEPK